MGMFSFSIFVFLIINVHLTIAAIDKALLCKKNYCLDYPEENSGDPNCATVNVDCNETKPSLGIFLPAPYTCNCCQFCLPYLKEGEMCSTGVGDTVSPGHICGPGLACSPTLARCVPFSELNSPLTKCAEKQKQYDTGFQNGNLGDLEVRANCDDDGLFEPYHCVPGEICYCVDKFDNRIYGEMDNNGKAKFELTCGCSRGYNEMSKVLGRSLNPDEYFRCAPNGNYEPLQCIEGGCLCVDENTGDPTRPEMPLIEIASVSEVTLSCFKNESYGEILSGQYRRLCEQQYLNILKDVKLKKISENEVLSVVFPSCDLSGNFNLVQETPEKKYCSYPNGKQIENFVILKNTNEEADPMWDNMDCKCALTRTIMTGVEKPICQENGNYASEQKRRGKLRNVDLNGNQCPNNENCQNLL